MASKKIVVIVLVLAALLVLASVNVYHVHSEANGTFIWHADEAYAFIAVVQWGYHMSYLRSAVEMVRELFPFGASSPSDSHRSVLVLRITPDAVQRYLVDDFYLGSLNMVGQNIYAGNLVGDKEGILMRWSGTHFEPSSPDERQSVLSALSTDKVPPGPSYDNVNGWSKRSVAGTVIQESPTLYTEKVAKVSVTMAGKPVTFVMNSGYIDHQAYIDMTRGDQPAERILSVDEKPHKVSRAEYKRIFGTH